MQIIEGPTYFKVRPFTDLRDMISQCIDLYGDRTAFRFRDDPSAEPEARTYKQFYNDVKSLGTALGALGHAGGRVAVVGENSYAWSAAHIAVVNGLGVSVPLDRMLPEDELITLLDRGEVDVLFYDASFQAMAEKAASLLPRLRRLVCLRPSRLKDYPADGWAKPARITESEAAAHFCRFSDLLDFGTGLLADGNTDYLNREIDQHALASLLFTSGTTSMSKAVMLSHNNICADIRGLAGVVKLEVGTRMLSVLPIHHTFENTCGLFMALYVGAEIHICDGLRYIQKNLQEYGIDMIIGVPLLFNNFYTKIQDALQKSGKAGLVAKLIPVTQALRRVGIDLRPIVYKQILAAFGGRLRLGICGAAPIDPEIIRFLDAVGLHVLQGYGLTETAPVACGCNSKTFVPGTVGRPLSGMSIAIDSENPGEPGEILIRGENVMLGYYQDPEATSEVIDSQGWFHSGDIGTLDPKTRCITITGRLKSMIVLKSGKKIFPEEIEYLIGRAGFIKESLIWGEMDEEGEIKVSAKLVVDRDALEARTGKPLDDQAVRQFLEQLVRDINAALPTFKGIRQYVFSFQEMVKTTTQKVRRAIEIDQLRDLMEAQKLKWRELTGQNIDQVGHKNDGNTEHAGR